ncbi:MAG: hypothetical protein D6741_00255 [Planctomycetota bacterium]|nr:MAG: hypothetical protein D6741_00255 [Planctomycetota bacterium]
MSRSRWWKSIPQDETASAESSGNSVPWAVSIRTILLWACVVGLLWLCLTPSAEGAGPVSPTGTATVPAALPTAAPTVYVTRHPFYLVRPRFWHPQPVPQSSVFQGTAPYQWGNLGVTGKRSWAKQPGYYSTHTDWIFR